MDYSAVATAFSYFIENNSRNNFLTAGAVFLGLFAVLWLFDRYFVYVLKRAAEKTKTHWDDSIVGFLEKIQWPFFLYLAFYVAMITLSLPQEFLIALDSVLLIFVVYYSAKGLTGISNMFFDKYKEKRKKQNKPESESMLNVMRFLIKIIIWSVALLMLLSNFGFEITPLIASLGIGGIAIGLAMQGILQDLFSAFAIYFDKPFQEGDFIIVGDDMGVVKSIGIKTTRVEALGGQEIVFSNRELTGSRINNYKKMQRRRISFNFGVEYQTTTKQLKEIDGLVKKVIDKTKNATFDRCHFKAFGEHQLDFEVVYYVETGDYNKYMDIQEKINFGIKESLDKIGVYLAFPTRTVNFYDRTKKR